MATKAKPLPDAEAILEVLPSDEELTRLVYYFPSYNREHRTRILHGFFVEKSIDAILDHRFKVEGKERATLKPSGLSGYKGWAHKRIKYTLLRLLYLRYLKDHKLKKHVAKARVRQHHLEKIMGHNLSVSRFNEITYSAEI